MSGQFWVEPLPPFQVTDATAVTANATLTELSPLPQVQTVAGAVGRYNGIRLRFEASGLYTTTGTQGTLTLGLYSGTIGQAIGSAVVVVATPAVTWVASQTNRVWRCTGTVSIRTGATSGTGVAVIEASNLSTGTTDMGATASGSTFTIDTTVARYWAMGATISVASQSIICRQFSVDLVN